MQLHLGTRGSELALWQAERVQHLLEMQGHRIEQVVIKTEGDRVLDTPLPLMGGQGVFTKALDEALYEQRIDVAVHSYKDYPTDIPSGLMIGATPEREDSMDVLVGRGDLSFLEDRNSVATIATGSPRRQGQWLNRYRRHQMVDVRGNIQIRLQKLENQGWNGIIMAAAGLKRLNLEDQIGTKLSWMLPAPAQAAMVVVCREKDASIRKALSMIHDEEVDLCTHIERTFLKELEGGCSAPIGTRTEVKNGEVFFWGNVAYPNGSQVICIEDRAPHGEARGLGLRSAQQARTQGADEIIGWVRKNYVPPYGL